MTLAMRRLPLAIILGAFLLVGAALSIYYLVPAAYTDFHTLRARAEVELMRDGQKGMPPAAEWGRLRNELVGALANPPDNAQLLDDIAFLYAFRAQSMQNVPELEDLRQSLYAESVVYCRAASKLRPMFPYGWAHLALSKHYVDEVDAELWAAFDKALAYGRNEPAVERMLAEIAFARWSSLDPQRADAIRALIADLPEKLQKPLLDQAEHFMVAIVLPAKP
jgi:hypothetical protein